MSQSQNSKVHCTLITMNEVGISGSLYDIWFRLQHELRILGSKIQDISSESIFTSKISVDNT